MKVVSYNIIRYDRQFRTPWKTSTGEIATRRGLVIQLNADNGLIGRGEAAPLEGLSRETIEETELVLQAAGQTLTGQKVADNLEAVAAQVYDLIGVNFPSARFALETALSDLAAQNTSRKLSEFLCHNPKNGVPVNYSAAFLEDADAVVQRVQRYGYKVVKIKVGAGQPEEEIEYINYLALKLGEAVSLRLDANRGWDFKQAVHFLIQVKDQNIEYIEEPLAEFNPHFYARLRSEICLPIALDESLSKLPDTESLLLYEWLDILIIKPSLQGGIHRSLCLIEKASAAGKKTVVTSLLETEIGIAALLHLAACLPDPVLPCGLDTLRYFKDYQTQMVSVANSRISLPAKGYGLGIEGLYFCD